jgi:hypothetical protein
MSATYFGDLRNTALTQQNYAPASAITASANSTGSDMILGDGNNCVGLLSVNTYDITSGNETYAIAVYESSDNVTFTAVVANVGQNAFVTQTSAGGSPGTAYGEVIFFQRTKRYLQVQLTLGGTTPSWLGSVLFLERLKITGTGAGYQS